MQRFPNPKRLLASTRRPAAVASCGLAGVVFSIVTLFSSATPADAQSQSRQIDLAHGEPPATLQFEPFDTQEGRRRLTSVMFTFDGEMELELTVENYDAQSYAAGEWSAEGFVNVLLAFEARSGYEDGGPFFGLGGISLTGVTGELSAGNGGGPFGDGIPGDIVATGSTSGTIESILTSTDAGTLDYFSQTGPLHATLGPLLDLLLSPPPGSFFIDTRATNVTQAGEMTMTYLSALVGDINLNGEFDANDIDRLYAELDSRDEMFDLNGDQFIDPDDVNFLVSTLMGSTFGDSNLDGVFNSSDLVSVFTAGEYEDGVAMNSNWASGDWNGDREFDTSDLVFAFEGGTYEAGAQPNPALAVPEATGLSPLGVLCVLAVKRRRVARPFAF